MSQKSRSACLFHLAPRGDACIWTGYSGRANASRRAGGGGIVMIVRLDAWSKVVTRTAAVVVVAAGASACSSVPSWVDPTTWIGGDDNAAQTPAEQTAENSST